ncbi:MAG TPA: guanylate kinase [Flavobacteriales bacterium]|nr:guanylate kinase [Flavobacteriales bacterium]HIO68900.1 guanylate kinase [Flavobacteriales bacterium]
MPGKLVIFSAPSGAGKTTIVHHLLEQDFNLGFSTSACSRDRRGNEVDGADYHFLGIAKFKEKIQNDEFIEWEEVYPDQFYGTLKSELNELLAQGMNVIFDVDVVGGLNIKKHYGDQALSVFVMPPSLDHLRQRLEHRSTETQKAMRDRLVKAEKELTVADQFDTVLVNDDLQNAFIKAEKLVADFLSEDA